MRTVEVRGGFSIDHLVTVGEEPQWYAIGGPGYYGSLGAAVVTRWRAERTEPQVVSLVARIPEEAVAFLEGEGVNLDQTQVGSVPLLWILNSPQGRRIVTTSAPKGTHELDETEGIAAGKNPEESTLEAPTSADVLLRCAPRHPLTISTGQIVCVDPDQNAIAADGWAYFDMLAPHTSVFLPSRVQLTQLGEDVYKVARELRKRTDRSVVARLDTEGSLVLPRGGGQWVVNAPEIEVVSTIGAGDSHAGAFAASLSDPDDPADLVKAAIVATAVVAHTLSRPAGRALLGTLLTDGELRQVRTDERTDI